MKKRVRIPSNAGLIVDLARKIREKHVADGGTSPLGSLNWNILNEQIDQTVSMYDRSHQLRRELKELFERRKQRDQYMSQFVRNVRDILTGNYSEEMKIMGQWGFDVLENTTSKPSDETQTPK